MPKPATRQLRISVLVMIGSTGSLFVLGGLSRVSLIDGHFGTLGLVLLGQLLVGVLAVRSMTWWNLRDYVTNEKLISRSLVLTLLTVAVVVILTPLASWVGFDWMQLELSGASKLALLAILTTAAVAEELVYRGALLFGTESTWGTHASVGISSVLFGLTHLPSGSIPAAVTVGIGLLWASAALRYGTILLPLLTHIVWNWLVFIGWILT